MKQCPRLISTELPWPRFHPNPLLWSLTRKLHRNLRPLSHTRNKSGLRLHKSLKAVNLQLTSVKSIILYRSQVRCQKVQKFWFSKCLSHRLQMRSHLSSLSKASFWDPIRSHNSVGNTQANHAVPAPLNVQKKVSKYPTAIWNRPSHRFPNEILSLTTKAKTLKDPRNLTNFSCWSKSFKS